MRRPGKAPSVKRGILGIGRFLLLGAYLLFVLAPVYWMVITAFKSDTEIVNVNNLTYFPQHFTLVNFISLFSQLKFGGFLKNSVILSTGTAVVVLLYAILGGYALARYKFRGKSAIILFFLISQMIPGILVIIPLYIIFAKLGLINTTFVLLVLYVMGNTPFCVITMTSFFERIPVQLEEAARVDGCSRMEALVRVIIPVLFPGIVAVFIFAFTGAWNDLLAGIIFTSSQSKWTIPVGMKSLIGKYNVRWGELMAGGTLALLPTVIMFAFVQRYVVDGLTAGSVKG